MNTHEPVDSPLHQAGSSALIAAICASGMAFIDATVVNVATAKLQTTFAASAGQIQWVVEAYALTLSALLLIGGRLGDIYGQKRVFVWGNILFGLSSLLCGAADSLVTLVLARAVQGVAAALLIPGSLALITSAFPEQTRARAIGIWSGVTAMMGAVGPFLGGWLIDHISWRAAFYINVPMSVISVFCAWRIAQKPNNGPRQSLNWLGATSMAAALATLTYALLSAQNPDAYTIPSAAASVVLFSVFVLHERRTTAPLFPGSLLKSSVFIGVNAITLFLYAALYGSMYFLPINLIQVHHYTASEAGAASAPVILMLFVLSPWTGALLVRFGARWSLTVGCCIVAAGLFWIAMQGMSGRYWSTFFAPMLVLGLGMSVCVSPLTTTMMNAAAEDQVGIASGINNAVSRVGGLLAVAIFGLILSMTFGAYLDRAVSALTLTDPQRLEIDRQKPLLAAAQYVDPAIQHAIDASFVDAFRTVMMCSAGLALLSAACACWTLKSAPKRSE